MWHIVSWVVFVLIVLWVLFAITDLRLKLARIFKRDVPLSVDESVNLLYVDQRRDFTGPPDAQYGGYRNAKQEIKR